MSKDPLSWLTSDQIYTRKRKDGVSGMEILALPDELRQIVNLILQREPVTLDDLLTWLNRPPEDVRGQVALLTAQGWLETLETPQGLAYRVHLARRRTRTLPPGLWQVLAGKWKTQLLRYLASDEQQALSQAFQLVRLEAGDCLFRAGEWNETLYLIERGAVDLVADDADGHPVVLARLKAGDILGEAAVLLGERCWATARARESVTVWALPKESLDRLLTHSPAAGLAIQREIERRITPPPPTSERFTPILVVGRGARSLAQAIYGYTNERLLLLDARPDPPPAPSLSASIAYRSVAALDGKALNALLHQESAAYDRVLIAAPLDLYPPLMTIIGHIALVIDLSGTDTPWVIAAARRRWAVTVRDEGDLERLARRLTHRLVGLALSGGAAHALAHIGVLQVLDEAQVPVDMLAGTGMGAVIAGLYAAGMSPSDLATLFARHGQEWNPLEGSFSLRLTSRAALFDAKRARSAIHKHLQGRTFADLRVPLYVLAADLYTSETVVLEQGPLAEALDISLALAGLVTPVTRQGRTLVDGGLINPMPADLLAARGADLVIGVNTIPNPALHAPSTTARPDLTSTWLRLRDQVAYTALQPALRLLDILITPQTSAFEGDAFDQGEALIAAGRDAARREITNILALLRPGG